MKPVALFQIFKSFHTEFERLLLRYIEKMHCQKSLNIHDTVDSSLFVTYLLARFIFQNATCAFELIENCRKSKDTWYSLSVTVVVCLIKMMPNKEKLCDKISDQSWVLLVNFTLILLCKSLAKLFYAFMI